VEEGLTNKVVVRFAGGRLVKGTASGFLPGQETLHVSAASAAPGTEPVEIRMKDLKGVFDERGALPRRGGDHQERRIRLLVVGRGDRLDRPRTSRESRRLEDRGHPAG